MIGLWLAAVSSAADPAALRGPAAAPTAIIGLHDLSIASPWPGTQLELGVAVRSDRGAVSVSGGRRWSLAERGAWKVHGGVSGGVLVPLVVPSVGVVATPWVSAGPMGDGGFFQGVLAAPIAASLAGGVRVPALAELQGGVHIGPVTAGLRFGLGAVIAPGTDVSVATEGALLLSYRAR